METFLIEELVPSLQILITFIESILRESDTKLTSASISKELNSDLNVSH